MLTSLAHIQNPWLRSLTAAATTFSAVTMASAITIAAQPNLKSAHEWGVKAALLAAGGGAALGMVYSGRRSQQPVATAATTTDTQSAESIGWQGWRNFIVVRKIEGNYSGRKFPAVFAPKQGLTPLPEFAPSCPPSKSRDAICLNLLLCFFPATLIQPIFCLSSYEESLKSSLYYI
jgi:hypothetical protein